MGGADLISANGFARHTAIWSSVAPTLDQVVRWANREKVSVGGPVRGSSDPARHSLISEVAFMLAKDRNVGNGADIDGIERAARSFLVNLPRSEALSSALTEREWAEANEICDTLLAYVHWLHSPIFSPVVPGCGVVDQATADVIAGEELIEVKAVNRPFRSSDFRQIVTYLAMYYSKSVRFEKVTLINPRLGQRFTISVSTLCGGIAGKAPVDVLQETILWMTGLQVSA